MAMYSYRSMDASGSVIKGHVGAVNEDELEQRLKNMGLELISCKEAVTVFSFVRRRVSRQELINFCFHMEQMSRVGVPIIESLVDIRDSMDNPSFREIISSMLVSIEGGKTFSEALSEYPDLFDDVFVSLVRAGEHSGELSKVLLNITESLKWQDEVAAQTKKVLMYPAFIGIIVLGVILFLMIYLVPQMVGFIQNMGHDIPTHTRFLILVSDITTNYWYLILGAPVMFYFMIMYLAKMHAGLRYQMDRMKLHVWLIGPILRKIILSRFANYFALLYASGVSVLQSLELCEDLVGNRVISLALINVRQEIEEGGGMSESFASVGLFPPLVLRMIRVGENTGRLDSSLLNVSYFYNRDVKDSIDKLQTLLEPAITVILGLVLGWVILSVLGPIYDIISQVRM